MTVRELWDRGIDFLNLCAFYYTVQLVRCVMISFIVFAVVVVLRKTLLKDRVFLKGALWALFVPVLFTGRMKFFDETGIGWILSVWWKILTIKHVWICWIYLDIVLLYAVLLFCKRRNLKKQIAGMERRELEGTSVFVTDIPVTPSTVGVFRPKIVMPEIILKKYDREEIQTILLHEKTHIRLGHLLFYLFWDVMRVLLWLNPLLTFGTGYFREDMEEICDWVTIQRSEGKAYTYGQMLLKSMRILQIESEAFNMYAAFAGDKEYRDIRQRMKRISGFKPYKQASAVGTLLIVILCVIGTIVSIKALSYDKNIENGNVLIYGFDNGDITFIDYSDELRQIVSYDDSYIYVDSEAFDSILQKNDAKGDIFIVFGGYLKLPGIGGYGYSCQYENTGDAKIVQIPYYNYQNDRLFQLFKMI